MSRSYKKTFYCGDRKGKNKKRLANHKVRSWLKQHPEDILNRNSYKKIYESWDICDYSHIYSWEQFWQKDIDIWRRWDYNIPYPDKKESYRKWLHLYKMK